jgi:hypothetical protein
MQIAKGSEERIDDNTLRVTRTSILTKKVHVRDLRITADQWAAWRNGGLVQNTMPHLTPDEREFLLTGATQEEWDAVFKEDES